MVYHQFRVGQVVAVILVWPMQIFPGPKFQTNLVDIYFNESNIIFTFNVWSFKGLKHRFQHEQPKVSKLGFWTSLIYIRTQINSSQT